MWFNDLPIKNVTSIVHNYVSLLEGKVPLKSIEYDPHSNLL